MSLVGVLPDSGRYGIVGSIPDRRPRSVEKTHLNYEAQEAALFAAAVLAKKRRLGHRDRSRVISCIRTFDVRSPGAARDCLNDALAKAGHDLLPREIIRSGEVQRAANLAQRWMEDGVFVLSGNTVDHTAREEFGLFPVFFARGERSLLQMPLAAVLNSRKPRQTEPDARWLKATADLVRFAIERGYRILSSYGTLPYCVTSYLAKGGPVIAVCPGVLPFMDGEANLKRFLDEYQDLFHLERTLFLSPFPPGSLPPRPTRCAERDRIVARQASMLLVAEVRTGGNMEAILKTAPSQGASVAVSAHYAERWQDKIELTVPFGQAPLSSEEAFGGQQTKKKRLGSKSFSFGTAAYLFHYTRSCPGPWPGQSRADYCRSLIDGRPESAHTGFDTLVRILKEGRVRAGSRLTRGPKAVVSFTQCEPLRLQSLVKWRRGLVRWSFEPYGIAIDRSVLVGLSASPVIYGEDRIYDGLPETRQHLFQLKGRADKDWSVEEEWRLVGDFSLRDVPKDRLVVIVLKESEAEAILSGFGHRVFCLETGDERILLQ